MTVARTDTFSGKFIDCNIDKIDHPFILGISNAEKPTELKTFRAAGVDAIKA